MGKIIAIVLQAIFVAGGVVGGLMLRGGPAPAASDEYASAEHDSEKDGDKKEKDKKGDKKADKGDGYGDGADGDAPGTMKFGRQFIVPVANQKGQSALVILDINIKVPPAFANSSYTYEPILRDAMLRALFSLSNTGAFNANLLEENNLDRIREELLAAAKTVIGDNAEGILILNVARQRL
ncbi:MAG: hypothetical protein AAGC77_05320 [Pseudomonadota bacterium]